MNSNDTEALVQAAFDGDNAAVAELLVKVADINANGRNWNALHAAIENMNYDTIELLLRAGADVEVMNLGMQPIHHAIDIEIDAATQANATEMPEPIITKMLLDAGANVNGEDEKGQTPLGMAIDRQHTKAAELLRSRGGRA